MGGGGGCLRAGSVKELQEYFLPKLAAVNVIIKAVTA